MFNRYLYSIGVRPMSKPETINITERYCPVIGKNVLFETEASGYVKRSPVCLNLHICYVKLGGCKNKRIFENLSLNRRLPLVNKAE